METITKEYKVYTFDELKPEVQQKVIDKFSQRELEYDWWDNGILDCIKETLKNEYGIECVDIYFDLYRDNYLSLGKADITDIKKFLTKAGAEKWMIAQNLEEKGDRYWDTDLLEIDIIDIPGRPDFNKINISHNGFIDTIYGEENEGDLEEEIGIDLSMFLKSILQEQLKRVKAEEEYIGSEENIKSLIECNDYKFLENGEIF